MVQAFLEGPVVRTLMQHALLGALIVAAAATTEAQSRQSTLFGIVIVDSSRAPVEGAAVSIAGRESGAVSDSLGRFVLRDIAMGIHEVVVRSIGYRPLAVHVTFATDSVEREFALVRVPVLDTVAVRQSAVIPSFEEHRAIGLGYFLTRAELEPQEGRKLSEIITQIRGIRIEYGTNARAWVISSRRSLGRGGGPCLPMVYLDDLVVYRSRYAEPRFDINSVLVGQIEAIEFYAGPATTPAKYSRLHSDCGVLVIHTRRVP